MNQISVDPRHLDQHFEKHRSFLHEITSMYSVISQDNLGPAKHLLDYLIYWLAYHILGTDQNMARQNQAIQSGETPSKAYEDGEGEKQGYRTIT